MYKIGADLKNVAMEILLVIVCDLVRLVLIYNKKIVVLNVVKLTANEEAFATRKAEKHLTAIVYMDIGIGIALLGIVNAKACVITSVCNGEGAAFEYIFHVSDSLSGIFLAYIFHYNTQW